MRWTTGAEVLLLAVLGMTGQISAQIRRGEYLRYVPPAPQIITRTTESDRLKLYGDRSAPGYRDSDPADGIDDARAARLLELAEHFSPILRRNNFSVPRDFRTIVASSLVLNVDRWVDDRLAESDSLELRAPAASARPLWKSSASNDARWAALLETFDPRRVDSRQRAPIPHEERVLFFDFPGQDERSWRRAYERMDRRDTHIFAHFFVSHEPEDGESRSTLTVQYWFFYPFNDGANNHEGDWEHLNVAITTVGHARGASDAGHSGLSVAEIAAVLDNTAGVPLDSLTVRWVAYYFHQHVMTLDYQAPVRVPECGVTCDTTHHASPVWEDPSFVSKAVERRKTYAGGRFATHPFVYVGGNNRGPDELMQVIPRFNASYNRNSHASYPLPSAWRTVGALDATERVYGELTPSLRNTSDSAVPWSAMLADDHYLTYVRSRISLLPDWEELLPLLDSSAEARAEWGWMILPIHFGYPASPSPGSGALSRVNMGNVSPFGPTFNAGWNRARATPDHTPYDPHVLRTWFVPTSPLTALHDGWGVLNWPIAAFGLLPGVPVLLAQLSPWLSGASGVVGKSPSRTFVPGHLPEHLTSVVMEPTLELGGDGFARLLPRDDDPVVARRLAHGLVDGGSFHRSASVGMRTRAMLHYRDGLAFENAYSWDLAHLRYDIVDSAGARLGVVRGRMIMQQMSAGFRVSRPGRLPRSTMFVRGGWMWTWYKVPDATLDDLPLMTLPRKGGHTLPLIPSGAWWPNSVYAGVGAEWYAPRRTQLFGVLSWGVSAQAGAVAYPLRGHQCSCILRRGDLSLGLVFGW